MVIRFSDWKDTNRRWSNLAYVKKMPMYIAISPNEVEEFKKYNPDSVICRCSDCATCGMCWDSNIKQIVVKIH